MPNKKSKSKYGYAKFSERELDDYCNKIIGKKLEIVEACISHLPVNVFFQVIMLTP